MFIFIVVNIQYFDGITTNNVVSFLLSVTLKPMLICRVFIDGITATMSILTLPYFRGGQVVTPAQR